MTDHAPTLQDEGVQILGGLLWLGLGAHAGLWGFLLSVPPGCLLLAGGVAGWLLPGDERMPELGAAGGLLGLGLALPLAIWAGMGAALVLLGFSGAGLLAAGWISQRYARTYPGVPEPPPHFRLALKLAGDELNLAAIRFARPSQVATVPGSLHERVEEVHRVFEERGWLEKPTLYHVAPPPLERTELTPASSLGNRFEHLRFESEYAPRPEDPSGAHWQGYTANQTAHAWLLRHPGKPRPWLICIHGFGLGTPWVDLPTFSARDLHERLGLNLLLPVLPLHGPRKPGRWSGDQFSGHGFLNVIHAEAQAIWDLRRLLHWVRLQEAPAVGVYGLSLGAYTAALLTAFDAELSCVIAGVPSSDLLALPRRLGSAAGEPPEVPWDRLGEVLRVVSPLAVTPLVARERRYIFGGSRDRIALPDQVLALWRHWDQPRIAWYAGGHVSLAWEPEVRALVAEAVRDRLLEH